MSTYASNWTQAKQVVKPSWVVLRPIHLCYMLFECFHISNNILFEFEWIRFTVIPGQDKVLWSFMYS